MIRIEDFYPPEDQCSQSKTYWAVTIGNWLGLPPQRHSNSMGQRSHRHRRKHSLGQPGPPTQLQRPPRSHPPHSHSGRHSMLSRSIRAQASRAPGFGHNNSTWNRRALTTYTHLRTNKGPLGAWLKHLGKKEDGSCSCGHHTEDGDHVTFHCPRFKRARATFLIPLARTRRPSLHPGRRRRGL